MSKRSGKDETSLHPIQQVLSLAADLVSCCCDSLGTLLLAPITEVGPERHSTTAPTTNHWFAPPRNAGFAVYLAFCTLPVMNIPNCIAQVLSPRTQEAAICGSFAKPHCRGIVPLFFLLCSAQAGFCSSPLQQGQRSIWPLTKQALLHVMETFTTPTSR